MEILVADDDDIFRRLLTHGLSSAGHHVIAVENGAQALAVLEERPAVTLVISDWMMPEMTGLDLCRNIRRLPHGPFIHILLLTARQTREDYLEAMEAGADDFLGKPLDPVMLTTRLRAAQRVLELQGRLKRKNELLQSAHENLSSAYAQLRKDIEAAAKMQQTLLPDRFVDFGWASFASALFPSSSVSGDIFNYFPIGDDAIGFYTLDVAGHGARAALMSFSLSRQLPPEAFWNETEGVPIVPEALVSTLNHQFQVQPPNMDYFTMVGAILERKGGLRFCQAGHPHPILVPADGTPPVPLGEGGFPVGLIDDIPFAAVTTILSAGDRVILHSDGITESEAPTGEMFGTGRFHGLLDSLRGTALSDLPEAVRAAIVHWQEKEDLKDDVSIIVLEMR